MIDKSPFKNYIIDLKDTDISFINNKIKKTSPESVIDDYINKYLDATRYSSDGKYRLTQTIDYIYQSDLSACLYVIENYIENPDSYMIALLRRHNENLNYEKVNPPIIYDKTKTKPKRQKGVKKVNETSLPGFENPRRESAAERKLKEKVFKINALKFKI